MGEKKTSGPEKSTQNSPQKGAGVSTQVPQNVVALGANKCQSEDCKKAPDRAGFCNEHFAWFKAGLITKEGKKASDFDKKFYHYTKARKSA